MNANTAEGLIKRVRAAISRMDEAEAMQKLMKAKVSVSLATKLLGDRYKVNALRDETKSKLEKFLSLAA